MSNTDAKKAYDNYMKSLYTPENIAKAGGVKKHTKIIHDYKKKQRIFCIKRSIKWFCQDNIPCAIIVAVIALLVKFMFIPSITYLNVLVITILATLIKRFIF